MKTGSVLNTWHIPCIIDLLDEGVVLLPECHDESGGEGGEGEGA